MSNIFIGSPSNRFTGGPTLAHQLCAVLRANHFDAYMFYYHVKDKNNVVHPNYRGLDLPYVTKIPTKEDTIIVAPETAPDILKHHSPATKVIWWMSVDNYYDKYLTSKRNKILNVGGLLKYNVFNSSNLHFVQSIYAKEFLTEHGISNKQIFYLSDYIDDVFLDLYPDSLASYDREDIIVYSPKRGLEFTKKIMSLLPNYRFIALENMSQIEMIEVMKKSKLYLDFGNHPGKDRIPREAALCGCCLVTSMSGSARNDEDIFIDRKYKFNASDDQLKDIILRINEIMIDYRARSHDFDVYRKRISQEKDLFTKDAINIFKNITSDMFLSSK